MTALLLETKLHVPRQRQGLVARPRLIDRLSSGAESALTLVSAPAGFGKTSLLADWLATDGRASAWLSLDQRDNDPALFWTYLVTALQTAVSGMVEVRSRSLTHPSRRWKRHLGPCSTISAPS